MDGLLAANPANVASAVRSSAPGFAGGSASTFRIVKERSWPVADSARPYVLRHISLAPWGLWTKPLTRSVSEASIGDFPPETSLTLRVTMLLANFLCKAPLRRGRGEGFRAY